MFSRKVAGVRLSGKQLKSNVVLNITAKCSLSMFSRQAMTSKPLTSISFNQFLCPMTGIVQNDFRRLFSSNVEVSPVAMPSLSPTMTHGTIAAWRKQPGEQLKAGDVLCEIETDKASVGLEVQDDSVLAKILVDAHGAEMAVGVPIALTVEDMAAYQEFLKMDPSAYAASSSSAPSTPAPTAAAPAAVNTPVPAPVASHETQAAAHSGPQRFSPAARHMVQSQRLDANAVRGTAKGGLVTKGDVIHAIRDGIAKPSAVPAAAPVHHANASPAAPVAAPSAPRPAVANGASSAPVNSNYTDIPASNMRKVIAKRLTESKATVPHFYTSIECEIDELMALRKHFKKDYEVAVSVNDLVIKSAALALRDVPEVNAKYNAKTGAITPGNGIVDISVAVATPNGLITPILTGADKRGLVDISNTVRDLAGRAREGKLKPEEYQGGSFSISNLGMFGISSFSAVINPPQACILAVGAGIPKILPPRAHKNETKPRSVTTVTVQLSSDRRVVDEATAAQFLQVFQKYLSNPKTIML